MEKPTSTTEPTELTFKCKQCKKGLKILIGKAHKSAQQKTPEKEGSDVEEPTLILTPIKVTGREEEAPAQQKILLTVKSRRVWPRLTFSALSVPKMMGTAIVATVKSVKQCCQKWY